MDSNDTLFRDDAQLKVLRRKLYAAIIALAGTQWIGEEKKLGKRANGLQHAINDRVKVLQEGG